MKTIPPDLVPLECALKMFRDFLLVNDELERRLDKLMNAEFACLVEVAEVLSDRQVYIEYKRWVDGDMDGHPQGDTTFIVLLAIDELRSRGIPEFAQVPGFLEVTPLEMHGPIEWPELPKEWEPVRRVAEWLHRTTSAYTDSDFARIDATEIEEVRDLIRDAARLSEDQLAEVMEWADNYPDQDSQAPNEMIRACEYLTTLPEDLR